MLAKRRRETRESTGKISSKKALKFASEPDSRSGVFPKHFQVRNPLVYHR